MARVKSLACSVIAAGLVSACGGSGPGPGEATLTISPGADVVYVGAPAIWVSALRTGAGSEPISWTLDGPGTLSAESGNFVRYTPPSTGDADAQATVTATAGALRSSAVVAIHPRPFTVDPPSVRIGPGGDLAALQVILRDPDLAVAWSCSLDGPGSIDEWNPTIYFYPPASLAETTTATLHVFSLDHPYVFDVTIVIEPRPAAPVDAPAPLSPPPKGFGAATIVWNVVQETGTMRGWADASGEGVILWGPTTFVEAAAWPREEGPADLTSPCVANAWSAAWDSCSFHFTEMKLGDPIWDGQVGGTWYFHGSFEASMNGGRDRVKATF